LKLLEEKRLRSAEGDQPNLNYTFCLGGNGLQLWKLFFEQLPLS